MDIDLTPALEGGTTISYSSIYDAICKKTNSVIESVQRVIFDGNTFECTYWGGIIDDDGYPDVAEFDINLTVEELQCYTKIIEQEALAENNKEKESDQYDIGCCNSTGWGNIDIIRT